MADSRHLHAGSGKADSLAMQSGIPVVIGTDSDDSLLIDRMTRGEQRALGELYDRYGSLVFALVLRIVKVHEDAEEVVADTFAQAWRNSGSFDSSRGGVRAWVVTMARSRALDRLRAGRRAERTIEEAAASRDESIIPSAPPSPETDAENADVRVLVRAALDELPATQREVIELSYFGGLSQSEIAARTSEPLGTVKTRMRTATQKLRLILKPLIAREAP